MKKAIMSLIFVGIFSSAYAERVPLIDSNFKLYEEIIEKGFEECRNKKSPIDRWACREDLQKKHHNDPIRGTEKYCEENYLSRDSMELEKIFRTLKEQQKTARRLSDRYKGEREPGEVTVEMLEAEILCVGAELGRRQSDRREADWNALFQKK
jgi:hypothetical protein